MATRTGRDQPSFSPDRRWTYDVFLNCRCLDTNKNFTDHLYSALRDAGLNAFRDSNKLRRGEDIMSKLLEVIQESRISIIVFSRNYAASKWCLEELVRIMECRKMLCQLVLPLFYDVDPSDVLNQTGSFAEAFAKHEDPYKAEMDKVVRWKAALKEAANLSWWDFKTTIDGHEAWFIKKIVDKILIELNHNYLRVAVYPVGIDARVRDVNFLLSVGSNDVRMIGICRMGGLGKTTIAKAVYNQFLHSFECTIFLANVRETSKQPNGQIRLQELLLTDILKKGIEIDNVDEGINLIKERLCNKKVLLVLDDVDQLDQLNAVIGERNWFGLGSRIIITTRWEHLLKEIEVNNIYMAEELNENESLELFSRHAFRGSHPIEDYVQLSKDVVDYSKGLPLALEVLGSFLYDRSIPEWESALKKLKRIPHDQIQKKLRISFDALGDDEQKNIFLDIACFFIGINKDLVIKILDGCGFFATISISALTCRCLLKIELDKLTMHDLLRDMGREIVREESYKDPGKRSRLWCYEDAFHVLTTHTGADVVEGLVLNMSSLNEVQLQAEAFAKMRKLRLLQLNYVHIIGGYEHFSKELRWLCWEGFPLKFIPKNFYLENLITIDMKFSNLRQVWKENKVLKKLKVLDLSHSPYLSRIPDFLKLPSLEELRLNGCKSLVEVHQSIGNLDKLILLHVEGCANLRNLPRSICMLKSLKELILSSCLKIDKLPEEIGGMESLTMLLADRTAIRQVPFSILRLKNLKLLSLSGCKGSPSTSLCSLFWSLVSTSKVPDSTSLLPTSLLGLTSLLRLILSDCNLSDNKIPKDLGCLSSLEVLDLSGNNFLSLPASISSLSNLQCLHLDYCTRLQSLPELPPSLKVLHATNCISLERLSNLSNFSNPPELFLSNCNKLAEVPGLEKLEPTGVVHMEGCNNLANTFKETLLQVWSRRGRGRGGIFLPGNEIPGWFSYQNIGASFSLRVPADMNCTMQGFAICIVYASDLDSSKAIPSVTVSNRTKNLDWIYRPTSYCFPLWPPTYPAAIFTIQDHLWVSHLPLYMFRNKLDSGDQVDIEVDMGDGVIVKKIGIHLVYDQTKKGPSRVKGKREREDDDDVEACIDWSNKDQPSKNMRYI